MKPTFDPRKIRTAMHLLTVSSMLTLSACGGGGGGGTSPDPVVRLPPPESGIGGTGVTSSGTLDGTGSIFVNGVRFDVDDAEILVNGAPASESDLGLGMVVTVVGSVDDDGENGTADRVSYDSALEGSIESLERNADNSSARLSVLGQTVIVERTSTVFEGVSFDALASGIRVEISGYFDAENRLRATRLERDDDDDDVVLTGVIADLAQDQFSIGDQRVDASAAVLDDLPSGLANGLLVEVEGDLVDGILVAREVDGKDGIGFTLEPDDNVLLQGSVRSFSSLSDFRLEGLPVDASGATLELSGSQLRNGAVVEVSGTWDGSRVVADRVVARRGRIELEAPLAAVDSNAGTLTLQFGQGTITVATDSRTLFDDDRDDIEYLAISDLAVGDYLEVEALQRSGELIATRVDRDDDDDETEIQAPVESFEDGLSLTVLGLRYDVINAEFENAGDDDIPRSVFFDNLSVGSLVRISDDEPTDGFAEEVEFEFAVALDGERDFTDDDEERIAGTELPQAVLDYLAANFPQADIAYAERDDDEIEVYLTDGTEVVFDLEGNFIESDLDDDDDSDDDFDDDGSDDDDSDDDSDDDDSDDDSDDDDSDDDSDGDDSDDGSDDDDSDDGSDDDDSDDGSDDDDSDDDSDDDDSDDDSDDDDSDDDDSDEGSGG